MLYIEFVFINQAIHERVKFASSLDARVGSPVLRIGKTLLFSSAASATRTRCSADKCSVKDRRSRLRFIKHDDFIMAFCGAICRPAEILHFLPQYWISVPRKKTVKKWHFYILFGALSPPRSRCPCTIPP